MLLVSEGFFTALRFQLFTPGNPSYNQCLKITAWFIVSLIILPARLGEILVIILLKKEFKLSSGFSIMSVISQRLIDLFFLTAMLLVFVILHQSNKQYLYIYISLIITILLLGLI